jgi:hypothetical protein
MTGMKQGIGLGIGRGNKHLCRPQLDVNKIRPIYILCRQMYTVLCYLTQLLLLNAAQHVSSLYKAHLQGLFR